MTCIMHLNGFVLDPSLDETSCAQTTARRRMRKAIHFIIALCFISGALGYYGELRIRDGGRSGLLQFNKGVYNWGAVCTDGFDGDAADVACRQLGYLRSTDNSVYEYYYNDDDIAVCYTDCDGDEDELTDCYIRTSFCDTCGDDGVVSITCTNSLTTGMIVGIVVGVLVFIGLVTSCVIVCICCLVPTCPCYYRSYHTTRTVVVGQPTAQVITATTTKATNYQPPPPPPGYTPSAGYQPVPPAATTAKY